MVAEKKIERTFGYQSTLPPLPVPEIDETLEKYYKSASVLLNDEDKKELRRVVEEFRTSSTVAKLQEALKNRASTMRNWIDDWWYEAYCEVREPLAPYLSVASIQARSPRAPGMQLHRAADATYHLMKIWEQLRNEEYPIMKSRGVVWDMNQYHTVFNSTRAPALPRDQMMRYFKKADEGQCPSNIVVLCRGNIWNVEMLKNGVIKSPDELFRVFEHIQQSSSQQKHSIVTLTSGHRDMWAKMRERLFNLSSTNKRIIRLVEESAFIVSLCDEEIRDENELLVYSMMGNSENQWQDKCMNIHVMKDAQISTQADHSNADAIVILDVGNTSGKNIRREMWTPNIAKPTDLPEQLTPQLDSVVIDAITEAEKKYNELKKTVGVRVVRHQGYGQNQLRKLKVYGDTVIQLAMQLAYKRTHGEYAPIYETASTRKFYLGRTETVRGRTEEMVKLGEAILHNAPIPHQQKLFKAAYDAHNLLMNDAMLAKGCDRHLYGLKKTWEQFNKGSCGPKFKLPELYTNKAWKHSGGDGNFRLSTSFIGYDSEGSYGYVCAMCPDGYGTFYKLNADSILLTATNFKGNKTNLESYSNNILWALDKLHSLFNNDNSKL